MFQKAENCAKNPTQESYKDLNMAVIENFFKPRMEYHRSIGYVEALLQGTEQEREALEAYVRTQPRLGKRKRKDEEEDVPAAATASAASATPPSTTNTSAVPTPSTTPPPLSTTPPLPPATL